MKKTQFTAVLLSLCFVLLAFAIGVFAVDGEIVSGDVSGDGVVDIKDLILLRQYLANLNYDTGISSVEVSAGADVDGNGLVRLHDLYLLREYLVDKDFDDDTEDTESEETTEAETETEPEIKYSEGLEFISNGDGTCYLNGTGICTDTDIVIPPVSPAGDRVTRIGEMLIMGTNVTSVVIPDSVTMIDTNAFQGCESLTSVTIGDGVTSIGDSAFRGCSSLTSIVFGENSRITSIGYSAFSGCTSLTSITIPDSVTSIGEHAFSCSGLTSMTIPNSVTSIGNYAFYDCSGLASITIPDSVTSIGGDAFYGCSGLTSIVFGENSQITSIGYSAFSGCTSLTSITIPDSVTSIGDYAFSHCSSLESITIPDSVTSIGDLVFMNCSNLESVTIGSGVTSIGISAFQGCTSLTSVKIGSGIIVIEWAAFSGCSSLETVYYNGSRACWLKISIDSGNEYLTNANIIFDIECVFGDWVTVKGASCTEDGEMERVCECGEKETQTIAALGHTEVIDAAVAATCTESGLTEGKHCGVCGEVLVEQEVIAALGHTEVVDAAVAATCTESGLTEGKHCSVCGEVLVEQEVIAALGHTEVIDAAVAATCTESGLTEGKHCGVCDVVLVEQEVIAALGHTEVIDEAVAVTCTESGLTEGKHCGVCDVVLVEQEVIAALGHTAGQTVVENNVAPDCVNNGSYDNVIYCTVCGDEITRNTVTVDALGHDEVIDAAVEATCTESGLTEGKHCGVCDVVLVEQEVIAALGHTEGSAVMENQVSSTCVVNGGYDSVVYCSVCTTEISRTSVTLPLAEHTVVDRECTVCDYIEPSVGLAYTLSDDGTYYSVSGKGECTDMIIVIPDTYNGLPVREIGKLAFNNFSGTTVHIPASVSMIGERAFSGYSSNLSSIQVAVDNPYYKSVNGTVYSKDGSVLVCYAPNNPAKTFTLPDNVTEIGAYAFSYADVLTRFVTTKNSSLTKIGDWAFEEATYISEFVLPDTICELGEGAFSSCKSLEQIPNLGQVTEIAPYLFNDCNWELHEVVIPDGITTIGEWAFSYCDELEFVWIPTSVTYIGDSAFDNAFGYTTIEYLGTRAEWDSVTKHYYFAKNYLVRCAGEMSENLSFTLSSDGTYYILSGIGTCTDKDLLIPSSYNGKPVKEIASGAFNSTLVRVTIPDSVEIIGSQAFYYNYYLTRVELGNGIKSIGDSAFYGCSGLTSITIPNSVTSIGNSAFFNCSNLTSVTIGNSVTSIGSSAFEGCSDLESIVVENGNSKYHSAGNCIIETESKTLILGCKNSVIPTDGSVTSIGDSAFDGCSGLTSVVIPDSVISIGNYAFYNCDNLTSITIPEGVTSIESCAFAHCDSLVSVTVPRSVTFIGWNAFYSCDNLTIYCNRVEAHPNWDSSWNSSNCPVEWLTPSEGLEYICHGSYYYVSGVGDCRYDSVIVIPSTYQSLPVIGIESYAFEYCWAEEIILPDSILYIEDYAFYYASSLVSIDIPSSIIYIGAYAFDGCYYLEKVNFEDTSCWYVNGASMSAEMSDPVLMAEYLTYTYSNSTWNHHYNAYGYENPYFISFPTCTEDGLVEYYFDCFYCYERVATYRSIIPATGHEGTYEYAQENYTPPTCTVAGGYDGIYNCYSCGEYAYTEYVTVPATGHTEVIDAQVNPTCTTGGLTQGKHCSVCEVIIVPQYEINALGHTYNSVTTMPSCTEQGYTTHTCYCGYTYIDSYVDAPGHDEVIDAAVEATCTKSGLTEGKHCGVCDVVLVEQEVVAALGHTYNDENTCIACGDYKDKGVVFTLSGNEYSVTGYTGSATEIIIPSTYKGYPVTSIGDTAFYGCADIKSITIPEGVTNIGESSFYGCISLRTISIPNSIIDVGDSAFRDCTKLAYKYYENACYLGNEANPYVVLLKAVSSEILYCDVHENTKVIYSGAFQWNGRLVSVQIPNSVTSIGSYAFYYCSNMGQVSIPRNVTRIGNCAFTHCLIQTVNIGNKMTTIGYAVFAECERLTKVTIASSVTSIEKEAFEGCTNLTSITIPSSVTSIDGSAFSGCTNLTSITVQSGNTKYHSRGNCLIETASKELILGCKNSVIPTDGSVTSIGESAFEGCSGLTSVTIPDGVTSIGNSAFSGCSGLETVYYNGCRGSWSGISIDSNNGYLTNANIIFAIECVFGDWVTTKNATCTEYGVMERVYECGEKETTVIAALGHTEVVDAAVAATCTESGLTEGKHCSVCGEVLVEQVVVAPGHTEVIDAAVAATCTESGLTEGKHCGVCDEVIVAQVVAPALGHNVGADGFCAKCDEPLCATSGISYSISEDGTYAIVSGYTGSYTRVVIASEYESLPVKMIGNRAFYDNDSITKVHIPDSVTSIGSYAFAFCSKFTSITIGNGVTSIGDGAFYYCSGLTSITIPDSVTSIGYNVFYYCSGLESIIVENGNSKYHSAGNCIIETESKTLILGCKNSVIPTDGSVTSIGNYAFNNCDDLTSITIPDSVTSIGDDAFYWCSGLTCVVFGENSQLTSIGSSAFSGCSGLTSITIPDGVTSIDSFAFSYCRGLASITIPDSVTSIGYSAFNNCDGLETVCYTGTEEEWAAISKGSSNDPLTSAVIICNYVPEGQ